jgi:hypothetical protein
MGIWGSFHVAKMAAVENSLTLPSAGLRMYEVIPPHPHAFYCIMFNPLMPNGHYSGRTALLTSRHCILNIYSTNIRTEYFKHAT